MRISLLCTALVLILSAHAEVVVWTNPAGGNWNAAANWTPSRVPGPGDSAVITNTGSYEVTINAHASIAALVVGGDSGIQTLSLARSIRLTLDGPGVIATNGQLNLTGDDLRGSNTLEVAGSVSWASGDVSANSAIIVRPSGLLTIHGTSSKVCQATLTNAGTVRWAGPADLVFSRVVHNLAGGLFEIEADSAVQPALGSSPVLINDGVLRKTAGAGTTPCRVPLVNNGRVETLAGILTLSGGSLFGSGCAFTGPGTNRMIRSAGFITLDGLVQSENLVLDGARITGTNTLSGVLAWTDGDMAGETAMTIATNGRLVLIGAAAKSLQGSLTNAGTIEWSGDGGLSVTATLHNRAGGVIDVRNDRVLSIGIGGSPALINDGLFRKSAGTGTTTCRVPLIHHGVVDTQTGTVIWARESVFHSGCAFLGAGTNLLDSGVISVNGEVRTENLVLDGATLSGTGSFDGTLRWLSGSFRGESAFAIAPTGQLLLEGPEAKVLSSLTNAGRIVWDGAGDLALLGVLHNLSGGSFEVRNDRNLLQAIGGVPEMINDGLFRKAAGTGTNKVAIPVLNHGTVAVDSGELNFASEYRHRSGTLSLAGGNFKTHAPLLLESGRLEGNGVIRSDVTSAAVVAPAPLENALTIQGKYTQLLAGSLEFELPADPPLASPPLHITGEAVLNGSFGVRLADPAPPLPGLELSVISFGASRGEFCCWNGLNLLGEGRCLVPLTGRTNLTLRVEECPEPVSIPLRITLEDEALICWPWEFEGFSLASSTNLAAQSWTVLPGATNRFLEPTPLPQEKFFRLLPKTTAP
ncbi:MAG: hypothetical protein AB9869_19750 [Verrucomicrobiia bacterium]